MGDSRKWWVENARDCAACRTEFAASDPSIKLCRRCISELSPTDEAAAVIAQIRSHADELSALVVRAHELGIILSTITISGEPIEIVAEQRRPL